MIKIITLACAMLLTSGQGQDSHYYIAIAMSSKTRTITLLSGAVTREECRRMLSKRRYEFQACLRTDVAQSIVRRIFGSKAADVLN